MKRMIYGESVKGASHVRNGVICQDSYKVVELSNDITIISAADGHGSEACPYSKTGSVIATNVFCSVMEELICNFESDLDAMPTYLNREGEIKIAQTIDAEWKRRVWKVHTNNKREKAVDESGSIDKNSVYRQYGTTLIGMLITPKFIFAFQLGDGDILYVDDTEVTPVIEGYKILGTETYSLSKQAAWKSAISMVRIKDINAEKPYFYMLSTDGFANSFKSQEEFYKTCRDYYDIMETHGFETLSNNMKDWLVETSELGCGDDITVVISRYAK